VFADQIRTRFLHMQEMQPLAPAPTMALPELFEPFRRARQAGQVSPLYLFVRLFTVVAFSETLPNLNASVQGFTPFFDCTPL